MKNLIVANVEDVKNLRFNGYKMRDFIDENDVKSMIKGEMFGSFDTAYLIKGDIFNSAFNVKNSVVNNNRWLVVLPITDDEFLSDFDEFVYGCISSSNRVA